MSHAVIKLADGGVFGFNKNEVLEWQFFKPGTVPGHLCLHDSRKSDDVLMIWYRSSSNRANFYGKEARQVRDDLMIILSEKPQVKIPPIV